MNEPVEPVEYVRTVLVLLTAIQGRVVEHAVPSLELPDVAFFDVVAESGPLARSTA
jgi:hypothetical protein